MAENIGNKWSALLNGAIDNDDTSLAFDNALGAIPAVSFRIVVQDSETDDTNREIMLVTAGTSTPLTVTRAQEGTSGVAHADNSYIVHILTAQGLTNIVAQGSPRAARVERAAAHNATTSFVAVPWDTEVRDDGGFWDAGAPTRLTAPEDGWYMVGAAAAHTNSSSDYLQSYIARNGSAIVWADEINATNNTPKSSSVSTLLYLTAGQYVEFFILAQATQAMTVGAQLAMWMARIT